MLRAEEHASGNKAGSMELGIGPGNDGGYCLSKFSQVHQSRHRGTHLFNDITPEAMTQEYDGNSGVLRDQLSRRS